jgi:hypothetical protein
MRKRSLLAAAVAVGATVGTVPGVAAAACDHTYNYPFQFTP